MDNTPRFPQKSYYMPMGLKILNIIVSLLLIGLTYLLIRVLFIGSFSFVKDLWDVFFIGITLFALFVSLIYWNDRLEVSDEGIAYYGLGFRIYTPWENIISIARVKHPHAFIFRNRPLTALTLRSPASLHMTVEEGKRRQVAVIEKHWLAFSTKPQNYNRYLPLFLLETLTHDDLSRHEIGAYIRRYAPQVLEETRK
jgi:hypothetical protein